MGKGKRQRSAANLDESDDILERLDRLEQRIASISSPASTSILERLDKLEKLVEELVSNSKNQCHCSASEFPQANNGTNGTSSTQWGQPPPFLRPPFLQPGSITQMINNAIIDSEQVKEKSMRAVLEKVPEGMDVNAMVKKVAEDCGIAEHLKLDDVHRHPWTVVGSDQSNKKPRIVKVPFVSRKYRDIFIKNFRKTIKNNKNFPQNVTVRRDMTHSELQVLYDLRRQAYSMNQAENLFKYIVVDLSIITLKNPHPLRGNNA